MNQARHIYPFDYSATYVHDVLWSNRSKENKIDREDEGETESGGDRQPDGQAVRKIPVQNGAQLAFYQWGKVRTEGGEEKGGKGLKTK